MPANKVHGVSVGDTFQAIDGTYVKVVGFVTPKSIAEEWNAKVVLDSPSLNGAKFLIPVTALAHGLYRKLTQLKAHNLGELHSEVSRMGAAMIDGALNNKDVVAVIDKNTGLISMIDNIRVEVHEEGGRTIWLEVEER